MTEPISKELTDKALVFLDALEHSLRFSTMLDTRVALVLRSELNISLDEAQELVHYWYQTYSHRRAQAFLKGESR